MADEQSLLQPALTPVAKPLSLIPVGLKEAALDSPTFRASALHIADQIESIERWLDNYVKAASKLANEVSSLETLVNSFLTYSTPPAGVSEAVLDHDYTLLAMKRHGESAREFWSYLIKQVKRTDSVVVEPIRAFIQTDLRNFRDIRKTLDQAQKNYDSLIARFASQPKTKEPSSLREDAFQLHEARKAYLKASMDFCVTGPQVRATLDKLLVRIFADQWRDMKQSRDSMNSMFSKLSTEMDRIGGWSREMENGERVFKRELLSARKQIEDSAEYAARPSRELEDYSASTVAFLGSQSRSSASLQSPAPSSPEKSEKQGWLFLKTVTGKPARTVWVRRWFYVKNGIFGWLVQGARSGGVEESEKIGVLLCNVRPAFTEERRFCFEVKTKDSTILLQAENQPELTEWIAAFDVAKRRALEDPSSTESPASVASPSVDAAFAISPPIAPEFAAKTGEGHASHGSDDFLGPDRSLSGIEGLSSLASRSSFDVTSSRRNTAGERDGENGRDHAARIIQKLDLHRKSTASSALAGAGSPASSGGIASLISASHNILPVGLGPPPPAAVSDRRDPIPGIMPSSTLAPNTLANPPAPTNLSKTAVVVSGERGVGLGRADKTGGMPSGIMANLWGSTNWAHINRLEKDGGTGSGPPSPVTRPHHPSDDLPTLPHSESTPNLAPLTHRKTISLGGEASPLSRPTLMTDEWPNYYPLPLKAQDAQFRILFPHVPREEKVVLVFRATWNPNDQQEFPGRVYVTMREIYFYSNHLGLVLITGVSLSSIYEITAAPGRDCDFIFVHLKEGSRQDNTTRITIKVFLEPLKLLQRRLTYLVRVANSDTKYGIEDVLKALIKMESDDPTASPSVDSWEDVSPNTPIDDPTPRRNRNNEVKTSVRVDGTLYQDRFGPPGAKDVNRFKLPSQPVYYTPQGFTKPVVEKEFDISAKALFHVMFGDKSAVFQMLYKERCARKTTQGPWVQPENGHMRRDLEYEVELNSMQFNIIDYQIIDVNNDHLCYVITDKKTPWHLPLSQDFMLVSKIVITHVAKSRCKLAIFTMVSWSKPPAFGRGMIERQALSDLELDAMDLTEVVVQQVRKLGANTRTKKAIDIFGHLGQQTQAVQVSASDIPPLPRGRQLVIRQRTFAGLYIDRATDLGLKVIGLLLNWLTAMGRWAFNICTAHTLILSLLLLSCGFNFFFTSRDTRDWWRERNAGRYLSRIGITPNQGMSKAVYLRDLDEVLANKTDLKVTADDKCLSTFQQIVQQTDMDAPYQSASAAYSSSSTKATARRLKQSRQNLGAYRHDLLVAMRLVNKVEREVLEAEWENWLYEETKKCRQVEDMLRENNSTKGTKGSSDQRVLDETLNGLQAWHIDYCSSCRKDKQRLEESRMLSGLR